MNLTSTQLKRIIKEELNHLMLEQQAKEAAEEAKELLSKDAVKAELEDIADNPKVAAALQDVVAQLQAQQMNEEYDDGGGLYGPEDGNVAAKAGGVIGAAALLLGSVPAASAVINSPAFAQLSDALSSVMDPALTALITGGAVMAGSTLAAVALALVANEVGKKS